MRHAVRAFLKSPACTAMFSVVRAFLLQPAPYPQAGQLVRIFRTSPQSKIRPHSAPDLDNARTQNHVFDALAAFQ